MDLHDWDPACLLTAMHLLRPAVVPQVRLHLLHSSQLSFELLGLALLLQGAGAADVTSVAV
jgi:hypothetical protein